MRQILPHARVARHAEAVGLDTVSILCSGDPDSLDALTSPSGESQLWTVPRLISWSPTIPV